MLKLYIYGYLNRVQSSRRLEREAGRNLEVMWLTGRLAPDHKTIADFRKDNGPAIKKVCAQFVELCRKMGLLTKASVAIDGSKFKAVNSRDNNFTQGKIQRRQKQIEESVARYMSQLETADRQTAAGEEPSETVLLSTTRLKEKLAKLEEEVKRLAAIEKALLASPDKQISLTDPDCRSMATSGRGSGMVAYNVQSAVDTTNHLIVAHEVTNVGTDRSQLATMAQAAKAALRSDNLDVVADWGYFKGEEILACEQVGIAVTLPKPQTSGAKSAGRFGKPDFGGGKTFLHSLGPTRKSERATVRSASPPTADLVGKISHVRKVQQTSAKRWSLLVAQTGKAVRQLRLNFRYRSRFILISHRERNFANKPVFAPVKANFPLLLDDHLFDDTTTESLSRRFLRGWTTRLHPA
jgi:hypothetical protein